MKKLYLLLIVAGSTHCAIAQQQTLTHKYDETNSSRWVADVNLLGGGFRQNLTIANTAPNYLNGVNLDTGTPVFKNGAVIDGDVQLGFFVGEKRHWGIGTGLMYRREWGDLNLDNFHAEYQAADFQGNTFRQVASSHDITERVKTDNFNIPLLLKYKKRFSTHWGIAADAGALFNISMKNDYRTNASFDYEAIYQYNRGSDGGLIPAYDPSPVPATRDWLITQTQYIKNNQDGNVKDYFNSLRNQGYNVGLGVTPNKTNGTVSYATGSVGFLFQPSVNYYFSDNLALNVGGYYSYQPFTNSTNGYRLTNAVGEYNSLLRSVTRTETHSFGANVGLRFFFGKPRDTDRDGIPDKKDECPRVWGLPQFNGCPDTDGDGIPDALDSCVTIPGLPQFHGCPDRDGDGIPDKDDLCPDIPGLPQFHGCPDRDGDGVPDNIDKCPDVPGPASNNGCPLTDTIKINTFHGDMVVIPSISTPILFETNKAVIHEGFYSVLQEAATQLQNNPDMRIVIDGHADITGRVAFNNTLSLKRANAVKNYLIKLGADPSRITTTGHGSRVPAATNKTPEGRSKNRRAVMTAKDKE